MPRLALAGLGLGAVASATAAWALLEAHAFTLRGATVPVLTPGSGSLRVLHISDLHLTPRQRDKVEWVRGLASLQPDLVVVTGDNLGHPDAVDAVERAFGPLSGLPGLFVFGSNDYFGPRPINPFQYFAGPSRVHEARVELPVDDLRAVFESFGWIDLNNARATLDPSGLRIEAVGMDDPHIGRDRMPDRAPGDSATAASLRLGVVHAPYSRALEALGSDGAELILAGHTHGGQVCVPGYGALVTNCDLPRGQAKGLSRWQSPDGALRVWLHVSAGLGTSPYVPLRFSCRPEATLLTLVERTERG